MIKNLTVADESYIFYASYDQVMELLADVREEYDVNVLKQTYPYAASVAHAVCKLAAHVLGETPTAKTYINRIEENLQTAVLHYNNL